MILYFHTNSYNTDHILIIVRNDWVKRKCNLISHYSELSSIQSSIKLINRGSAIPAMAKQIMLMPTHRNGQKVTWSLLALHGGLQGSWLDLGRFQFLAWTRSRWGFEISRSWAALMISTSPSRWRATLFWICLYTQPRRSCETSWQRLWSQREDLWCDGGSGSMFCICAGNGWAGFLF